MTINFNDFEKGDKYKGDYDADLAALQDRMTRIQQAHIISGARSIIMFEGWDAAGKGGIITRMTGMLDPRYYEVWPIAAPSQEEKERHFLYRFWKRLPGKGEINVFDRSWYGRVLVERIEGYATEAEWKRAYDEINEFEAQQIDNGTQPTHAGNSQSVQNKLLEAQHGNPLDTGATAAAGRGNQTMEAVGAVNRPTKRSR